MYKGKSKTVQKMKNQKINLDVIANEELKNISIENEELAQHEKKRRTEEQIRISNIEVVICQLNDSLKYVIDHSSVIKDTLAGLGEKIFNIHTVDFLGLALLTLPHRENGYNKVVVGLTKNPKLDFAINLYCTDVYPTHPFRKLEIREYVSFVPNENDAHLVCLIPPIQMTRSIIRSSTKHRL